MKTTEYKWCIFRGDIQDSSYTGYLPRDPLTFLNIYLGFILALFFVEICLIVAKSTFS